MVQIVLGAAKVSLRIHEETPVRATVRSEGEATAVGVSPRILENGMDVGAFPPTDDYGITTAMISFVEAGVYELRAEYSGAESNSVTLRVS